jgi:cellulose synthase operon protein C
MPKSSVERYEQLLAQDPASSVFVELAKALIAQGELARAIEVCERGIQHHPSSIKGRVLWGKALIFQGKPSEALAQFDQAIAIERDNPYAYTLIAEVLLQKGLYRSALPILRKAVALRPDDGRVKEWLDQAQAALAGGSAPTLQGLGSLDAPAEEPAAEEPAAEEPTAEAAPAEAPADKATAERDGPAPQQVALSDSWAQAVLPPAASGEAPAGKARPSADEEITLLGTPPPQLLGEGDDESTVVQGPTMELLAAARRNTAGQVPVVQFSPAAPPAPAGLVPPVDVSMSGVFEATPELQAALKARSTSAPAEEPESVDVNLLTQPIKPVLVGGAAAGGQELPESVDVNLLTQPIRPAPLGEQELPESVDVNLLTQPIKPAPTEEPESVDVLLTTQPIKPSPGLMEALPELPPLEVPEAPAPPSLEEVAAAYERELRARLMPPEPVPLRSSLRLKVAVALVLLAAVVGAALGFREGRSGYGARSVAEVLEGAEELVAQDTRTSLTQALRLLARGRQLEPRNPRVLALAGHAHALLYAEHGGSSEDRTQALELLGAIEPGQAQPGPVLAAQVLLAEQGGREAARQVLLSSKEEAREVHAEAGLVLLESGRAEEALARLRRALELPPRSARVLAALGAYYQQAGELEQARRLYGLALQVSPEHPLARLGEAEARLALGQGLQEVLASVEAVAGDEPESSLIRARQQLVLGRVQSALGRYVEARERLNRLTQGPLAFEALLALGGVEGATGNLEAALAAYESALKLRPESAQAREELGRALVERGREREALRKLEGSTGLRLALVRAEAHARLGEWRQVRSALEAVAAGGRYPAEALALLAQADAVEGRSAQARQSLERALESARGEARARVRLALGQVYRQERNLDKAAEQLEAASKEGRGSEALLAYGRLLVERGELERAVEPLQQAVARNSSSNQAREALGHTLLTLGRTIEALQHMEAWELNEPQSAAAHEGYALALYHAGRFKDAVAAADQSLRLAQDRARAHRVRAVSLFATGDMAGGFAALERSNKVDPRSAETFCEIALAFLRQGLVSNASKAFEAARREGPEVPCGQVGEYSVKETGGGRAGVKALQGLLAKRLPVWDRAFAQAVLARALMDVGDKDAARAAAEEAVKLAPFSGRVHLEQGRLALQRRDDKLAESAFYRAVELEPADGPARLALADLLARTPAGAARAVSEYEAFLRLAGDSPEARRVKKVLPALKEKVAK